MYKRWRMCYIIGTVTSTREDKTMTYGLKLKHVEQFTRLKSHIKAEEIVEVLNSESDDGTTFKVGQDGRLNYVIEVYDETGEQIGVL